MRRSRSSGQLRCAGAQEPTYVQSRQRSEYVAHFSSGAIIQVELGRKRRYPGLSGPAPHTHLCYRHIIDQEPRASRILDIGCGSGVGLRCLLQATHARLTGLDSDGKAVAFAREYVPEVEVLHANAETCSVQSSGCVGVVVDVLGLVANPVQLLRGVASHVKHLDSIFLVESAVNREPELIAPARRAFSPQMLLAILARAGFAVDQIDLLSCGMLCVTAHPARDPASVLLQEAEQAYLLHQTQSLIELCQAIHTSTSPTLKAEAALLEARLRFDLEQRGRTIALLSDARALIPHDARPIAGLARLALVTGNHEQAVCLAEQAAKLDPAEFSALCSLALVYANGQHSRSMLAWRAASALVPDDNLIAQMAFASAFIEGRLSEGIALVERQSLYQSAVNHLTDHAGLAGLVAAARRKYLTVSDLAALQVMQSQ
jgi:SAM-dependent methyltransferase